MNAIKVKEAYFVGDCPIPFYILEDKTILMPISNNSSGFIYKTIEQIRANKGIPGIDNFEKAYEVLSSK